MVSFNGATLTVIPDGEKNEMRVTVRPATKMLKQEAREFSDIHPGDFIGGTLMKNSLGVLTAQELHLFPESLRGSGEGLYPASPGSTRMILNGTVGQVSKTSLGVRFRGASGDGPQSSVPGGCTGRAPADPLSGCQGSLIVSVPATVVVLALADARKEDVKPGDVLALSLLSGPDGRPATPGFTIESVSTPPIPLPDGPLPDRPVKPRKPVPPPAGKRPR